MPECYIRGSTIKYLRIPDEVIDMVKEDVQAKSRNRTELNKGGGRGQGGGGGGQQGGRGGPGGAGGGGRNNANANNRNTFGNRAGNRSGLGNPNRNALNKK